MPSTPPSSKPVLRAHDLVMTGQGEYYCTVCRWTWHVRPLSKWECPGLTRYEWGQAPRSLQTRQQLARRGLTPGPGSQPRGCYQDAQCRVIIPLYSVHEAVFSPRVWGGVQKQTRQLAEKRERREQKRARKWDEYELHCQVAGVKKKP